MTPVGDVQLVLVDYIIFGLAVGGSLSIGLYFALSGGKQKTTSEYLMGNRHMKIVPVALSLMVSFESSIMMLGFPAETYVYGIMFWLSNFGFWFANIIATRVWVPLIHPLKVTSVYEYLELRYKGKAVRTLGTILGGAYYIFYMGIVLYGPAIALGAITNFPIWASIILVAGASVIYTSLGGIKAVIWTDVFQSLIMFMGIFAVIIKGTIAAGGSKEVFEIGKRTGRLEFFDFNPDPTVRHTFWNLTIGSCVRLIGLMFNQSTVQRIAATPTQKTANRVLLLTGPAFFLTLSLASFEGLVAYAYFYAKRCDPLASNRITNSNQIIPYMVLDIFRDYPGMPGLFMASLFSASLSTLSSGLSSLTAQTTEDFIRPVFKGLSEFQTTLLAKLSVFVYGGLAIAVSFLIINMKEVPISQISFSVLAAFTSPLTGMMIYSAYCPWATKKGAIVGALTGVCFIFWISMGQNFSKSLKKTPWLELGSTDQCFTNLNVSTFGAANIYNESYSTLDFTTMSAGGGIPDVEPQGVDRLYSISYQWLGALGIIIAIVVGTIVSFITGRPDPDSVDVRYILPIFDYLFPFLPKKVKKFLHGGVNFEKRDQLLAEMDKGIYDYEEKMLEEIVDSNEEMTNKTGSRTYDYEEKLLEEIVDSNEEMTNKTRSHIENCQKENQV